MSGFNSSGNNINPPLGGGGGGVAAEIEIDVTIVTGGTNPYFLITNPDGTLGQVNPATYTGFPIQVDVTTVLSSADYSILFTNPTTGTLGASANFGYIEATSGIFNSIASATEQANFSFSRARAGVTAVANGDSTGIVNWFGYDGSTFQITAAIEGKIAGTVSAGNVPQALQFLTSSTTIAGNTTKMFIGPTGIVAIGYGGYTTNASARLDVFAPGTLSTDIAFRIRENTNTYSIVNFSSDGEFRFMNRTGFDLLRMKADGTFGLGYNININNATSTDVCINPHGNMGATGDNRTAVGRGATCNAGYTTSIGYANSTSGVASAALGMTLAVTGNYSMLLGSGFNGTITNNIDNSLMWTSGASGAGNYQSFFVNSKSNLVLMSQGQLTAGTHYDTTATNTITLQNGTIASGVIADATMIHAKDTTEGTPKSALAIFSETVPAAGVFVPDNKVRVWWNGVQYYIGLEAI